MGDRLAGRPRGHMQRIHRDDRRERAHPGRHIAHLPSYASGEAVHTATPRGPKRWFGSLRSYLPSGNTLDEDVFRRRHLLLCWVLGLHVPSLFAFGIWQGFGVGHSAVEVAVPVACLVFGRLARNRRLAAFFVTAGLVYCSSALVHLSGGTIEAHFHFFILIGLIALYQDWVPFLWNVVFTVLSHGLGSSIAADLMYNHDAAQDRPWSWAVVHGVAVLAACVGVIVFWRNTETEQVRSRTLAGELAAAELAAVQSEADRRQAVSELFVNLARRNQSLLDRQLALIAELEQNERSPEALGELFKLDHLATRIRRNAESLLVLSGEESPRRWGRPMPLGEVVRAAAAEVEDYRRVKTMVNNHLEVEGRVAADLAHLLAELLENATSFSSPETEVWVRSYVAFDDQSSVVVSIEDMGIGMREEALQAANQILTDPPEVDLRRSQLGLHVVSRLAKRYGLQVRLVPTPGGGVTALVTFPTSMVHEERRMAEPVGASVGSVAELPGLINNGGAANGAVGNGGPVGVVPGSPEPPAPGPYVGDVGGAPSIWGDYWHLDASAAPAAPSDPPPSEPTGPVAFASPPPEPGAPTGATGYPTEVPPDPLPGAVAPTGFAPPLPDPSAGAPSDPIWPSGLSVVPSEPSGPPPSPAGPPGDDATWSGTTPDGLVRRVPGAQLPGGLRRPPAPAAGPLAPPGPGNPAPPGPPTAPAGTPPAAPGPPAPARDPEQTRSMLSRFQAGQRAGRSAVTEGPGEGPASEAPGPGPTDEVG